MSHINFECSSGIALILLFQMGSEYTLGVDGDLDLPLSLDADLESLLLGGTHCALLPTGDVDLSLDFSLDLCLSLPLMDLGCDRDLALFVEFSLVVK